MTAIADDILASRPVAAELQRESVTRVRLAALVVGALWLFTLIMNLFVAPVVFGHPVHFPGWPYPAAYIVTTGTLLSLGMAWLAGALEDRPALALDLSLVFWLIMAALIAFLCNWRPIIGAPMVSWLAVLGLIYPSLAPNRFRKSLATSMIAASMDPLFIWIAARRGIEVPRDPFVILWHVVPNYLCGLIGLVPMVIVKRLGHEVQKAREVGSYVLGDLLGSGGMGEVYRATHRLIARPAAVKLIRPDLLAGRDPGVAQAALTRFRREAEAAAALRSPHTIELYDFGVKPDGSLYYVMELLDGFDLQSFVERFGPVGPGRSARILGQVASSLAEAHQVGLVHRDIKPSNVFLCRMGLQTDFVKVLDFGLVKREHQLETDSKITLPDGPPATPAFSPPELGLGLPVDHRADIYALGCLGYWLLTRKLVFDAAGSIPLLFKHAYEQPVRPSTRTGLTIPAQLEDLIMQCLEKDPAKRPDDARVIELRLEACAARMPWASTDADRWWGEFAPKEPR